MPEIREMARETVFDEVFDSQATFRALLDVMSRPGTIHHVPRRAYRFAPRGFCLPALSILKTLCDHRVSFSVGLESREADWIRYLEVNIGSPFQPVVEADYVLFSGDLFDEDYLLLSRGSPEFPERSATAIVSVDALEETAEGEVPADVPRCVLHLSGPGVNGRTSLTAFGLDPRYGSERRAANRGYPLGVDLLFVDPDGRIAAIPRSSRVETA